MAGFVLGFACCWLLAGGVVMRAGLDPAEWRAPMSLDTLVVVTIGLVMWPWLIGGLDGDA